jgi:hypothetical protein
MGEGLAKPEGAQNIRKRYLRASFFQGAPLQPPEHFKEVHGTEIIGASRKPSNP